MLRPCQIHLTSPSLISISHLHLMSPSHVTISRLHFTSPSHISISHLGLPPLLTGSVAEAPADSMEKLKTPLNMRNSELLLFQAIIDQNRFALKVLIEQGVDPNCTKMMVSLRKDYERKKDYEYQRVRTPLLVASMKTGREDIVKQLLASKMPINVNMPSQRLSSSNGRIYAFPVTTALTRAAALGHWRIVRRLVDHGADVDERALCFAVHNGDLDIVKLLISHGAKVDAKCLEHAKMDGREDIMRLLLDAVGIQLVEYYEASHVSTGEQGQLGCAPELDAHRECRVLETSYHLHLDGLSDPAPLSSSDVPE